MPTNFSFLRVHLENFKVFNNLTVDLQQKSDVPKPMIIIYGANGSGKSSFMESFYFLVKSMESMQIRSVFQGFLEKHPVSKGETDLKYLNHALYQRFRDSALDTLISKVKMLGSDRKNMLLSFDFLLNGSSGTYSMSFSNKEIIAEALTYRVNKYKGDYFSIEKIDDEHINVRLSKTAFGDKENIDYFTDQLQMFWGRHTFLSIISNELNDKNISFLKKTISESIFAIVDAFSKISIHLSSVRSLEKTSFERTNECLKNLGWGLVDKKEEATLDQITPGLKEILCKIMPDLQDIYYSKEYADDKLKYELNEKKIISNQVIDVPYRRESSGNLELLKILPYLVQFTLGRVVMLDEYGSNMHNMMACNLITSLLKQQEFCGQLIISTHNLMLLKQKDISEDYFYFVIEDKDFNREIKCCTEIEERTYPSYNYFLRYTTNDRYKEALPNEFDDFKVELLGKYYN